MTNAETLNFFMLMIGTGMLTGILWAFLFSWVRLK